MPVEPASHASTHSEPGYRVTDQGSGIGTILLAQLYQSGVADERTGDDFGRRIFAGLVRKMTKATLGLRPDAGQQLEETRLPVRRCRLLSDNRRGQWQTCLATMGFSRNGPPLCGAIV